MRLSHIFVIAGTFLGAMGLSYGAAHLTVRTVEKVTSESVEKQFALEDMPWVSVQAEGLQVFLDGTAPSETERLRASSVAGTVVDASRVINNLMIEDAAQIAPPEFTVEILRGESGISLIGLVPPDTNREDLIRQIRKASGVDAVTDLLETADYPYPDTWEPALDYAVAILGRLPQTKISVNASRVAVIAMAESARDKERIESDLARRIPDGVRLALDISAPRPVITPFTLRFLIEGDRPHFDACSADDEAARDEIIRAAGSAGMTERPDCVIGLGVPSPSWGKAAALSIAALKDLGGGTLTMSDADISIVSTTETTQARFDDVVGRLESALPDLFALHAELPAKPDASAPPPEFVATLSPEGLVQMRGQISSSATRDSAVGLAKARFAADAVHSSARVTENLPGDWTIRVLTAMEILPILSNGAVVVTPEDISVRGQTGQKDASAQISSLLTDRFGATLHFNIDVSYVKELDLVANRPSPQICQERLDQAQNDAKITFDPGSSVVATDARDVLDSIARILKVCGQMRLEIAGHTDSQGSEQMNAQLSQARAQAVLTELLNRDVLTSSFTAKGYGESEPIADNGTEDGREANRRIEFNVYIPEPIKDRATALEAQEQPLDAAGQPGQTSDDQTQSETTDGQN